MALTAAQPRLGRLERAALQGVTARELRLSNQTI